MADLSRLDALLPQGISNPAGVTVPTTPKPEGEGSFSDVLKNALSNVNDLQNEAAEATQQMLAGENQDIEAVMIALEKAGTSLQMMLEVRNSILKAYQEVMRTQM
jgi:flagellar hook-basal body complex protein FliE